MITYESQLGESIEETVEEMISIAKANSDSVLANFNGKRIKVDSSDTAQYVVKLFHDELERENAEYRASDEYKKRTAEREKKHREHALVLEGALSVAPAKMTFADETAWNDAAKRNDDPYGSAVMRFADRWARLMELRMSEGWKLEDTAKDAAHMADSEGITGFMYGCAVTILSKVWIHGEALRRWHNLDTQIGQEGERANDSGGVLNPAILTIG